MNKDDVSKLFINKFNSCYPIKTDFNPNLILWIYDENFIRKLKLCKVNNQEITIPNLNIVKNVLCLFVQNTKSKILYIDYNTWITFENNINIYDYDIISDIITPDILKKQLPDYKYKNVLPYNILSEITSQKNDINLSVYTSYFFLHFEYLNITYNETI